LLLATALLTSLYLIYFVHEEGLSGDFARHDEIVTFETLSD
jgi:hypothetical protein